MPSKPWKPVKLEMLRSCKEFTIEYLKACAEVDDLPPEIDADEFFKHAVRDVYEAWCNDSTRTQDS